MRQSVQEYVSAVSHFWWVLMPGILTGLVGGGLDVATTTELVLWSPPAIVWRLIWIAGLLITLVVAPFLAFHKVRTQREDLKQAVEELRRKHPIIHVGEPQKRHDHTWFVEVANEGEAADVRAEYRILEGASFVPGSRERYQANWEGLLSPTCRLLHNERRTVGIAQLNLTPIGNGTLLSYNLLYWDEVLNGLRVNSTTSWAIPGKGISKPTITLEFTLTSDPRPAEDAVVRRYQLDEHGLSGL